MTTTRINHTGHNHPNTTAARTACRKANATPAPKMYPALTLGRGAAVHIAYLDDNGKAIAAKCGSGMYRGVRHAPALLVYAELVTADAITCTKCRKHI